MILFLSSVGMWVTDHFQAKSGLSKVRFFHALGNKRKELVEAERISLDPATGSFGCIVPAGTWHTVQVYVPSVIYEAKDGKYGGDGSESYQSLS